MSNSQDLPDSKTDNQDIEKIEKASSDSKPSLLDRIRVFRSPASSEEELREIVDDTAELADDEKRMIHDIIDLGDMTASEICTPRVDVMFVEEEESGRAALERMRGTGYSRLPVCRDEIDNVVGMVHYKDLIGPLMDGSIDDQVTKFMYEAMYVPETKDVIALLGEMQARHQQMAIVVDEYGGCEGVITIEDIVEEIVGEIADESDIQGEVIASLGPGSWRVAGSFSVEDAAELGWPVEDSDDYETIAGWLISRLDSVPDTGELFELDGYRFTIEKMRRSRITLIKVEKISE